MNIFEYFNFVISNMLEKKGRVFLTLAGIVIGIFTFTFFIFVSQGLSNAIVEQFSSVGANVLAVQLAGTPLGVPGGSGLVDTDVSKIKQVISEYKYVAPGIALTSKLEYGRIKSNVLSISYPDENLDDVFSDIGVGILEGRNLRQGDRGVIILGYKTATESFGDKKVQVGSSIKIKDKNYRVIGIYEEQGDIFIDTSSFLPFNDAKDLADQDTYSLIRVSFNQGADLDYYKEQILRKLNPNGKEKRVKVTSSSQAIDKFNQILGLLTGIIVFISSVALFVGGINVMNTMYSNVLERINEISVMKAIGATNFNIFLLYLIESAILGLLGGLIGFSLAYSFAILLSYIITTYLGYNVPIYFDFIFFMIILMGTIILTMIFGTYPAMRASKINLSDNLRDE